MIGSSPQVEDAVASDVAIASQSQLKRAAMNEPLRAKWPGDAEEKPSDRRTPVVNSVDLLAGQRELLIQHGGATYRLRLTASNKLILTK